MIRWKLLLVSCVGIGTGSCAEAERAVRLFPHIDLGGRPGAAHGMGGAGGRVGSDVGPAYLGSNEGLERQGRARLEARAATGERVAW